MTIEELHKIMEEGEVIFMDDPSYKSENTRALSGYSRFGNDIYQISRSIIDFKSGIVDIQLFLCSNTDEDYFLVEIRGINLYKDESDSLMNPEIIEELILSIYYSYNPEIRYTPSKIYDLIKRESFIKDISPSIKDIIFVHHGTYLGIQAEYFTDEEFSLIYENYISYMNNKVREYESKKKLSDVILGGNPIYETINFNEDIEDEDRDTPSNKSHIGLYFNKELDRIIQFTKEDIGEYSSNLEYYFYDSLGKVSTVVYLRNISNTDIDKYKVPLIDKNYIEKKDSKILKSDSDFIKLLFSGIEDEEFTIRNWEKVEIERNPKNVDVKSYDTYSFLNSLSFTE